MIDWSWWHPLLAVAALAVGGWFAVHGTLGRGAMRTACWTHGLMALAMGSMFRPGADPVPAPVGAVVFGLLAAGFAAVRLRRGADAPGDPGHVAVGCAAMVVMYLGMSRTPDMDGMSGHAGHTSTPGSAGLLVVALGLALTGYFAWHAWATSTPPAPPAPTSPAADECPAGGAVATTARRRLRTENAAHLVLDVLMAVMFLGAL